MSADVETIVVGAGAVGLAVARALAKAGREVMVLEQHELIGSETSSRNSEVIHAGIYYPPGSLRATLCVRGKESALPVLCESTRAAPALRQAAGGDAREPAPQAGRYQGDGGEERRDRPGIRRRQRRRAPSNRSWPASPRCSRPPRASSTATASCWRWKGHRSERRFGRAALPGRAHRARRRKAASG